MTGFSKHDQLVVDVARIIDPPAFSERYRPGNPGLWERWMSGKGRRISKAVEKSDRVIAAAQAEPLAILSEARLYVTDALDAHEHSDGRELLARIDTALSTYRQTKEDIA
jgi:hypothetical protein